ncbi:hypothetical protein ALQ93_200112 [Pseudomonas syringae pv. pisi]|nr:hypothetical protein ALQ93_200112 [Pseudomonas syringae pv. pisi]
MSISGCSAWSSNRKNTQSQCLRYIRNHGHDKRVRFFSTVDLMNLVNLLEREKYDGKAERIALRDCFADLVVLDDLSICHQPKRRHPVISPAVQTLRTHQCDHHHQPQPLHSGA